MGMALGTNVKKGGIWHSYEWSRRAVGRWSGRVTVQGLSAVGSFLRRLIVPAVVCLGIGYPASFLLGMWDTTNKGQIEANGAWVGGGSVDTKSDYNIYKSNFPQRQRVVITKNGDEASNGICALEVYDGPEVVNATAGEGTQLNVTLDKALPGQESNRITIDLASALKDGANCAATIRDGQIYYGNNGLDNTANLTVYRTGGDTAVQADSIPNRESIEADIKRLEAMPHSSRRDKALRDARALLGAQEKAIAAERQLAGRTEKFDSDKDEFQTRHDALAVLVAEVTKARSIADTVTPPPRNKVASASGAANGRATLQQ